MNKTPTIREIAYTLHALDMCAIAYARAHARKVRAPGDMLVQQALRVARRELKRAERDWRDLKLRVLCAASIEDAAETNRESGRAPALRLVRG